jgi:hypothetical protein
MNQIIKITFQKVVVKQGLPYKKTRTPKCAKAGTTGYYAAKV